MNLTEYTQNTSQARDGCNLFGWECAGEKKISSNQYIWYLHSSKYSLDRPEQMYWFTNLGGGFHTSPYISKILYAIEEYAPEEDSYCCCFPQWPKRKQSQFVTEAPSDS